MWAVLPIPSAPLLSRPSRPPLCRFLRTLSRSTPPKNDGVYDEDITGLGGAIFTNLNSSSSSPAPKRHNQKQKQADGNQLSGSDVLWALHRAAAKKNKVKKKKKKRREVSSANTDREDEEDDDVDFSNVKPLCIKTEWVTKLEALDKRLQELSEFNGLL